MVTCTLTEKPLLDVKSQSIACFLEQNEKLEVPILKLIQDNLFPNLMQYLQEQDFKGQAGKIIAIPCSFKKQIITVFLIGVGKRANDQIIGVEQFRRACGTLIKAMQQRKIDSCSAQLPLASLFGVSDDYLIKQAVIATNMAAYRFDTYITDEQRKVNQDLTMHFHVSAAEKKRMQQAVDEASIIAKAVNKVRFWIDLPPTDTTPTLLAKKAQEIAKAHKLSITVFDEPEIIKMGMGGLAGVSAGSEQDCKFVILEYKTKKKNAPTLAFVGKGITFDSGGLSLKPASAMETMKEDMSGAAAVIGTMEVIAQLKPDVNIVALTPIAENLPSGKATKPGDIVRFYNGKTAEVKNTDAEGRLILADALSYAVKHYKPDAMIDLATLTGACAYALGPFFSGLMGKHGDLLETIEEAAQQSGDAVWRLPFTDDYKAAIVSDVADMCNSGKSRYRAGATTAGFFLANFVGNVPWAHLDIAGTAFDVPDISYYSTGATGVGVRLLVDIAMNWQKK